MAGAEKNAEMVKNKIEQMKIIGDHYRMDIRQVWERGRFFTAANGALLAFAYSDGFIDENAKTYYAAGICLSVAWLLVALSTNAWVATWRKQLMQAEEDSGLPVLYFSVEECVPKKTDDLQGSFWVRAFGRTACIFQYKVRPHTVSVLLSLAFIVVWATLFLRGKS